ncbi:hypothetical protein [Marinobacter litoralis]|uniref:hypothetical protein n=1 Tax=Marinobacter litoralis TaxID=187981 RepID=UPI0018EDD2DD|nr:hypothetical protein [Marinobacter litoralis]MBJ6136986.1 hypothetical protein [Marinobacter litoralis]
MHTVVVLLCLAIFLGSGTAMAKAPIDELDDQVSELADQLVTEDYDAAYESLWLIDQLRTEHQLGVPESYWYYRGVVAAELGDYVLARTSFQVYQAITNGSGRFSDESAGLLRDVAPKAAKQKGNSALDSMFGDMQERLMDNILRYTMNVTSNQESRYSSREEHLSTFIFSSWSKGECRISRVEKVSRIRLEDYGVVKRIKNVFKSNDIKISAGSGISIKKEKGNYFDKIKIYFTGRYRATYNGEPINPSALTLSVRKGSGVKAISAVEEYLDFCKVKYSAYVEPKPKPKPKPEPEPEPRMRSTTKAITKSAAPAPYDYRAMVNGDDGWDEVAGYDHWEEASRNAPDCESKQCDLGEILQFMMKTGVL